MVTFFTPENNTRNCKKNSNVKDIKILSVNYFRPYILPTICQIVIPDVSF